MNRIPSIALLVVATVAVGLGQGAARGAPQGAPPAGAGRGAPVQPPLGSTPKPAIPNAKPVRSCESLAMVSLPNTTIESAKVDANNADVCRVTAITTHPPAVDKVRIWVAIPMSNWNGRFLGTGGGGFVGEWGTHRTGGGTGAPDRRGSRFSGCTMRTDYSKRVTAQRRMVLRRTRAGWSRRRWRGRTAASSAPAAACPSGWGRSPFPRTRGR